MDLIRVGRKDRPLAFELKVRSHALTSDMSPSDGGKDAGFSPAELLAGSLGACVAMALQGWCDATGHGQGDVDVSVTLELADDPKRVAAIVADVELPDGTPEDRRKAARRVVEHCLIHETLRNPPRVDVKIL